MGILQKVIDILKKVLGNRMSTNELNMETELRSIGIGSIDFIKIVVEIENEFNVKVEDDILDITNFPRISDFISYINNRLNESDHV